MKCESHSGNDITFKIWFGVMLGKALVTKCSFLEQVMSSNIFKDHKSHFIPCSSFSELKTCKEYFNAFSFYYIEAILKPV